MNLLIEYFKSKNYQRETEYRSCISENVKNNLIKKIIIFIDDDSDPQIQSDKIQIIRNKIRPTFKYLFEYCNLNFQNEICVISNTDIIFDETLSIVQNTNLDNTFLALTRWDIVPYNGSYGLRFFNVNMSQDSWMFKSPVKIDDRLNIYLGKPGIDNRVARLMHDNGYDVKNPGKQIITKHFHVSGLRYYTHMDVIPGPYLTLEPNDDINTETIKKTIDHF